MPDITNETDREIMVNMRLDVAVIKDRMLDVADLKQRVGVLESRMWQAIGAFGVLAIASPVIVTYINSQLTG